MPNPKALGGALKIRANVRYSFKKKKANRLFICECFRRQA